MSLACTRWDMAAEGVKDSHGGVDSGSAAGETGGDSGADTGPSSDTTTETSAVQDIWTDARSLDFGAVSIGSSSTESVLVSNNGLADLEVASVEVDDPAYSVVGAFATATTLRPGQSRTLELSFEPDLAKHYPASAVVNSDDPDEPRLSIELSGEGSEACTICAPVIDVAHDGSDPYTLDDFLSMFGAPDTRTVTVSNIGDEDLLLSEVVVNNDTMSLCGEFSVGDWTGALSLTPGESTSFTISYVADEICMDVPIESLDQNVAHIRSDDPVQPDFVILLGGTSIV